MPVVPARQRLLDRVLSLRSRAIVLTAVVFAAVFGMLGYLTFMERAEDIEHAKTQLFHAAEKIAAEQKAIVVHADQHLRGFMGLAELRRVVQTRTQWKRAPDAQCSRLLADRLGETRILMSIGVSATNGDVLCHALQPQAAISIADRAYFQEALRTRGRVISDSVVSRANDRPAIVFARALRNERQEPLGVVWVALSVDWLGRELASARLAGGAQVGLLDANGMVLARYPDSAAWTGKDTRHAPVFRRILASGKGTMEELGLEGEPRIFAFTPFAETVGGRLLLWMSVPKHAITEHVEREFAVQVALIAGLLLFCLAAVWLGGERIFLRPVSALSQAARRIAGGDLGARTGLRHARDELGQLARSFDFMAESLKAKEAQLFKTHRALRVLSAGNRALLRATDETVLLQEMCRAIAETGGYRAVWVGYAENDAAKTVRPVASWGIDRLEDLKLGWGESHPGRGPTGTAIRHGIPAVVRDMAAAPNAGPWRDLGARYGFASALSLPLRIDGGVTGALAICAHEPDAFADEEVQLLSEAAADLSFGITTLRTRVKGAQLEASLKSAEDRFRAAAEANPDALFIFRTVRDGNHDVVDFQCTDLNRSAEKLLGAARDKAIGATLADLLPSPGTGGLLAEYRRVVETGTVLEEEVCDERPGTQPRWLRRQVVGVGDGIAVSCRDITAWKEAGMRLRESESRYRQLFEANPHPMWVYDRSTLRFLMVNDAAVAHYGYSREEFQAMTIGDLRPTSESASPTGNLARVENARTDETGVCQHRKKDGTLIDVEITDHVLYLEGRRAEMVLAHDVTAQRRAESERRESEKKFRTLFEQAPVGVVIRDVETGMPLEFNRLAHEQLGYTREQFAALCISDYEALESPQQTQAHMQDILRKGRDDFETRHRTRTGEMRNVRVMIRLLQLGDRRNLYCIYSDVTEQKRNEKALQRANRGLRTLSAANEVLVHAADEGGLLEAVCRVVVDQGGYRAAAVGYAQDDAGNSIRRMASCGLAADATGTRTDTWADSAAGQRPVGLAIRNRKPAVVRDIAADPAFGEWTGEAAKLGCAANIALPLLEDGRAIGALDIYASDPDSFDPEEVQLLEELAGDLAYGIGSLRVRAERDRIAHEHARHEKILRTSLEESIQAIADTIDMRDPYTAGHQRRVAELAEAIAREMGLPEDQVHGVRLAASIHDLGKIKIPAEILAKPGKLTDIEFMLIQTHAEAGYEILKEIAFPWPIATIVWQHHEKLDGSGYPQGLERDQILLESRIMAVADVVEAMSSHRPYRAALGMEAAYAEIEAGRGVTYDEGVVDTCLALFREGRFAFRA